MKQWEPEEVFDSADFPLKKRPPQADAQPPQSKGRVQPSPSTGQPSSRPPAQQGVHARPGEPRNWEPDLDFERADFSGVAPEDVGGGGDRRSSSSAMADLSGRCPPGAESTGNRGASGPQARSWQPPRIGDAVKSNLKSGAGPGAPGDKSAQTPRVVGAKIRPAPGASASPTAFTGGGNGASGNPPVLRATGDGAAASGYTRRLLQELTIQHRESARHILRHWYWEKAGMAPEGLGHIQPRDRIYIILAGLGPRVLVVLYESMSPTERRQMQEILDRPPNVTAADVHRVQSIFMTQLRLDL